LRRFQTGQQSLRNTAVQPPVFAGTFAALVVAMANQLERWTIPLHVLMWTTFACAFIMILVVVMMN
jgi:hypothetical protein